jgi:predicted MFS family arabinose efflux permease
MLFTPGTVLWLTSEGALNQGWIADKISRRYSIMVAVVIFTIGSILQTTAIDYPMLVVARFIGGIGIGM